MTDDARRATLVASRRLTVAAPAAPRRGHLHVGDSPAGADAIEVTSRYVERAGRPWFPVTGEIHYARIPRDRWSEVLGHARAGGLACVETYVLWQAHEPEPGRFRWDGGLDLRAFVELAAQHGLDVVVRMGPWAHGEARYGGFPDWLVDRGLPTRTNDPEYLELVRAFYAQTVAQLVGLAHADGGPIVGAQMDNELYDQPQHLARLREIAEEAGLRVPIWTATGWGGAQVPETLLPVYGAYSDGFWDDEQTEWPAFASCHFRYSPVRDDLSVGADLREALDGIGVDAGAVPLRDDDELPFATCELGGGMHVAYHRRPLVTPRDIEALALAKVGSGSIWQGYYMYAGGTQRTGPHGSEQESHATGYPNDVPRVTYDFAAPIGEHAQIRPHHHHLRRQHLWLHEDGHRIAAMTSTVGGGSEDLDELRWAVRSDGHSGYLFVSTHQPAAQPLPGQQDVQVTVDLADDSVTVPTVPVDIPAGVSLVWPLRYPVSPSVVLRSATAQVLTRGSDDDGEILVLGAYEGIPVELVLDGPLEVGGAGTGVVRDGTTVVSLVEPAGPRCVVELPGVRIMVLDPASAERLYVLDLAGRDRLVLSDAPLYALGGELVVHPDEAQHTLWLLPAPAELVADGAQLSDPRDDGPWRRWALRAQHAGRTRLVSGLEPQATAVPDPVRGGPLHRLSAPTDFTGAAVVHVDVPAELLDGADRALLRLTWTGDVGRAFVGDRLVSDHFWHGRVWDVDLTPWVSEVAESGVRFELLPWRRSTGVWVHPSVRYIPDGVHVAAIDVVRVGRVRLTGVERD
ncbi:beta-galactosidase [Cellulomonas sp.]|uniref:beta-galactosidase n=1 Tax=Cellulomonas sp. TaxID=40001 RepID=UPI003BAC2D1F